MTLTTLWYIYFSVSTSIFKLKKIAKISKRVITFALLSPFQAAVVISQGPPKHKLQFLIGDVVLPFNMTVYQAVRQFGCSGVDHSEAEADSEPPLGHDAVWVQTHTIYYRYFQTA